MAYSLPEIDRIVNMSKQTLPKRHWSDLREALSAPNSVRVFLALTTHIESARTNSRAEKELSDYKASIGDTGISTWCHETKSVKSVVLTPEQMDVKERLVVKAILARSTEFSDYRALLVEIHGEPTVEYAEYLDRRREQYGWNVYAHPLTLREWDETDGYETDEE